MKICCLGDSLTEGDYGIFGKSGIGNVQKEGYPYFLEKLTNADVLNFGKSGYKSVDYLSHYKSGAVDVKDANIIIIMLGTNGGQDPDLDTKNNKAYIELINLCKSDAPNARIMLCTPPHVTENKEMSNFGYAEQVKKAVEFIRKTAVLLDLSIIETANCPDFTAENENIMQPNDGLHFSKTGYKILAEYIYKNL